MNFFKAVPYHLARYICVENDFMPSVTTLYIGIILTMCVCMCVYMYIMLFRIECIDINSITL